MERESVRVLREAIELQNKKAHDYQNPKSTVQQADYYVRGVWSIWEVMHGKMLRARSLMESDRSDKAQFESLEDTFKDLINYASFAVAWSRGKIPGQDPATGLLNDGRRLPGGVLQGLEERADPTTYFTEGDDPAANNTVVDITGDYLRWFESDNLVANGANFPAQSPYVILRPETPEPTPELTFIPPGNCLPSDSPDPIVVPEAPVPNTLLPDLGVIFSESGSREAVKAAAAKIKRKELKKDVF